MELNGHSVYATVERVFSPVFRRLSIIVAYRPHAHTYYITHDYDGYDNNITRMCNNGLKGPDLSGVKTDEKCSKYNKKKK